MREIHKSVSPQVEHLKITLKGARATATRKSYEGKGRTDDLLDDKL